MRISGRERAGNESACEDGGIGEPVHVREVIGFGTNLPTESDRIAVKSAYEVVTITQFFNSE